MAVDLTGKRVGEYQVVRRIGLGGMGVVFEGLQPEIGKRVAIKMLLPQLSADQELVERFRAEARAVNAIGHRGIVDIFSFGRMPDGLQYFVMEYLDGRGFDAIVSGCAPVEPGLAIAWFEEILDALGAAHQAGIIHRDIKPSNLFLVDKNRTRPYVKLLDFGIAKMNALPQGSTPQTSASLVVGTPEYIAPEQAQGRAISPATDLYAMAVVMFELLTGRLPFDSEHPLQTMYLHVNAEVPRASAVQPGLPRALDELLYQLMQKDPARRPRSAEAVLQLLSRIDVPRIYTAPVPRWPTNAPPRAHEPTRRARARMHDSDPRRSAMPGWEDETNLSTPPAPGPSPFAAEPTVIARGPGEETVITRGPEQPPAAVTPVDLETGAQLDTIPSGTKRGARPRWLGPMLAFGVMVGVTSSGLYAMSKMLRPAVAPVADAGATPAVLPAVDAGAVGEVEDAGPAPQPEAAVVEAVRPAPAPAPVPVPVKRPPSPPAASGPSDEQLRRRLAEVEAKLDAREVAMGRADNLGRNYLQAAREQVRGAKNAEQRRACLRTLDDLARELDRR